MLSVLRNIAALIHPPWKKAFFVISNPGLLVYYYIFLLLIVSLSTSCKRINDDSENRTVFRYNEAAGISSLDPAYAKDQPNTWACNQLYDGLVRLDRNLKVLPAIAHSWEISDDGLKYIFYLKQDIWFHDDKCMTARRVKASDFVFSFSRLTDPDVASPGAWIFRKVSADKNRPGFQAINDSILQISLSEPFPPFLGMLTMQYCSVVPFEAIQFYGKDFRRNPVGTGPFQFKMWKEGIKLILLKNDDYFEFEEGDRLPYLDAVAINFLADKQSAFLEFVKGKLDFLSGIDPGYKDEILTRQGTLNPKYADRFYLLTEPFLNTEYLGIQVNPENLSPENPLLDVNIRKAMNLGFDRVKMIKYLRNNIGKPGLYGIIPPGMLSFDSTLIAHPYDPDEARRLIRESDAGAGSIENPIVIYTNSDYLDLCKFIQHQLGEIGFKIEIEVQPPATLRELKAQAKLGIFRASWIADYPDEENYLSLFYSKNFTPNGPNYTHFSNSDYDSLYLLAQRTQVDSLRLDYYKSMNMIIMAEAPVIILYYDQVLRFISKDIRGMETNPMNMLDLRRVKKNEIDK